MKIILNETDINDYKNNIPIVCIYKITNLLNGKLYIGQTVNFRKRISDYRNSNKKKFGNNMYSIISKYGEQNFSIEIIIRCKPEQLNHLELYYIDKFDSISTGYNKFKGLHTEYCVDGRYNKSISHIGLKESAETKRKKSNYIIAMKDSTIIISDSGKLFGDYINRSKDYIKNCLRQPSTIEGYYLFYLDFNKRNEIKNKMLQKRCIRNTRYMELLELLNDYKIESVETIYSLYERHIFDIYELKYENINSNNEVFLKKYDEYVIFIE